MPILDNRYHLLPDDRRDATSILLVGCGGTGSQMLMGLGSLAVALRETGRRPIHVATVDDDRVSTANLGRQPFHAADVGGCKAEILTSRINLAHGLAFEARAERVKRSTRLTDFDLVIACVDTLAARRDIHAAAVNPQRPLPILDCGNRSHDGQVLIGEVMEPLGTDVDLRQLAPRQRQRLLHFFEHFPDLLGAPPEADEGPSCSVAEALERQSLFINRTIASHALAMLWDLLSGRGIGHAGVFLNLAGGRTAPIPLTTVADHRRARANRERREQRRTAYRQRRAAIAGARGLTEHPSPDETCSDATITAMVPADVRTALAA